MVGKMESSLGSCGLEAEVPQLRKLRGANSGPEDGTLHSVVLKGQRRPRDDDFAVVLQVGMPLAGARCTGLARSPD